MPETLNDKTVFSLQEVTRSIQKTLRERYTSSFWVTAEMNKINYYKQSGHCYPDLVEKKDGKVIAQIRAHLWKDDYNRINLKFQSTLQESLKDGIKILFLARIVFDASHGLSLWIMDIDPAYTLGDLEKEKQETIHSLKSENCFDQNRSLKLPLLPQRLAIISVDSSKGYADFIKVIGSNPWNYKFFHFLFPAVLQGERAVADIIYQLKRIKKIINHFDVVAIIRGGGGDIGLSCYNNYNLAKEICAFPIPVITGIGHATNETVTEMVAHFNAITPTKLAEYLLQKFHNYAVPVKEAEKKLVDRSKRLISEKKTSLHSEVKMFRSVTTNILQINRNQLDNSSLNVSKNIGFIVSSQKRLLANTNIELIKQSTFLLNASKLAIRQMAFSAGKDAMAQGRQNALRILQLKDRMSLAASALLRASDSQINNVEQNIKILNPKNVLKRGFTLTTINSKIVKTISEINTGDIITTILRDGTVNSKVESKKQE